MKNNDSSQKDPIALPFFLSTVPAGFPSPAEGYFDKTLDLNDLLIQHPASTFFIKVVGDSMQGAGIHSEDILIIDRSLNPSNGKIVLAIVNGEFTVKRLILKEEKVFLIAENPAYPSLQIHAESEFEVWGVVTYVIHKAR